MGLSGPLILGDSDLSVGSWPGGPSQTCSSESCRLDTGSQYKDIFGVVVSNNGKNVCISNDLLLLGLFIETWVSLTVFYDVFNSAVPSDAGPDHLGHDLG